jgi:hypothetical protein
VAITPTATERRLLGVFEDLKKAHDEGKLEDLGSQVAYNTLGVLLGCMKAGEPLLGAWNILVDGYAKTAMQIGDEAIGKNHPKH